MLSGGSARKAKVAITRLAKFDYMSMADEDVACVYDSLPFGLSLVVRGGGALYITCVITGES